MNTFSGPGSTNQVAPGVQLLALLGRSPFRGLETAAHLIKDWWKWFLTSEIQVSLGWARLPVCPPSRDVLVTGQRHLFGDL